MGRLLPKIPGFRSGRFGVFSVERPARRVIENISPDAIQRFVVADDVLVIIALPRESRVRGLPNKPRRDCLIFPNDLSQSRGAIYRALVCVGNRGVGMNSWAQ